MWKSDLFSFRLSKKYNLDIESNDPKLSHINGGDVVREDFQSNHFQVSFFLKNFLFSIFTGQMQTKE